ncbi:OsmC family protein [Roseateles sp. NT4]|uniref:OsmC family protein n=1 Tax=Roseateles sp. NT4 TaxID=3453715 RepID=UPI003EE86E73
MRIAARVGHATGTRHEVEVQTAGPARPLDVAARPDGGSTVNGGEFLMLALATCYCNDLYREARRLGLVLDAVEVVAEAEFDGVGLAARDVRYRARVESSAGAAAIEQLLNETDAVAEVHNTLRAGAAVRREPW